MQKHDEKRKQSEGGCAHRQVVDILEKIMGRIFGRGRGARNQFHTNGTDKTYSMFSQVL